MQVRNPATNQLATPDGFRSFYAEALPRVYGYLFTRCGHDKSVAEDLTQEVFFAAAREIKQGKSIDQPMPWIVGIARHKLLDHFRRERFAHLIVLTGENDDFDDAAQTPPDYDTGDQERIAAALASVPSSQRDALILHFMDDLPVAEVALRLGRSRTATESLIARGRISFRNRYLEAGDDT
jgi:RNA polymerase sigma-70 factor (ECF subfamily)